MILTGIRALAAEAGVGGGKEEAGVGGGKEEAGLGGKGALGPLEDDGLELVSHLPGMAPLGENPLLGDWIGENDDPKAF